MLQSHSWRLRDAWRSLGFFRRFVVFNSCRTLDFKPSLLIPSCPSPFLAIHDWHIWLILPLFWGLDLSKDLLRLHKGQTACQREPAMRQWFHLFTSPTRMMPAMVSWHMGQPGYLPASAVCKYISATQGVDNLRSLYSEADS